MVSFYVFCRETYIRKDITYNHIQKWIDESQEIKLHIVIESFLLSENDMSKIKSQLKVTLLRAKTI